MDVIYLRKKINGARRVSSDDILCEFITDKVAVMVSSQFLDTCRFSTSPTSLSAGIQTIMDPTLQDQLPDPALESRSQFPLTTILLPPTNDPYGSMAIWLMALWLYRMTIWLMTVWRIPQCRGRLLGHTQGTPTVPRGPVTSSHCTMCSAAMCAVPSSRSPMECARLCSRIKGCSHPFYHPPVLQLVTYRF